MTTPTAHECSFPVLPPLGSIASPGPCDCGKTWDRSQAELMLAASVDAINATDPGGSVTCEHETVDDLRREYLAESATWREAAKDHRKCASAPTAAPIASAAYTGSLMAANYASALAAVLGVAGRELGEPAARRLAWVAYIVITDGDCDGHNADLRETSAPS
jgi:hypothetical protein